MIATAIHYEVIEDSLQRGDYNAARQVAILLPRLDHGHQTAHNVHQSLRL